jgi:hypothetical protein
MIIPSYIIIIVLTKRDNVSEEGRDEVLGYRFVQLGIYDALIVEAGRVF